MGEGQSKGSEVASGGPGGTSSSRSISLQGGPGDPTEPSPCDTMQAGCQARLITEPPPLLPLMRPLG